MTDTNSSIPIPDRLLTVEEVAQILSFSPRKVRDKAKRGEIPSVRIGRDVRFHPDAIRELLASGKE
jgi:excisionase family DNA binding protein